MNKKDLRLAQTWLLDIKNHIQNIQGEWKERDEKAFKIIFNILHKQGEGIGED